MSYKDIPSPEIPAPRCYEDFKKPVIITKDYYNKLPDHEKSTYEKLNKRKEINNEN